MEVIGDQSLLDPAHKFQFLLAVAVSAYTHISQIMETYLKFRGLPVLISVRPVQPFGSSMLSRRLCSASPEAGRIIFLPLIS